MQIGSLLANLSILTPEFDDAAINYIKRQLHLIQNQDNNQQDTSLQLIRRVITVMQFPQTLIDRSGQLQAELLQKPINSQFFRIMPYMITEILQQLPYKTDPF